MGDGVFTKKSLGQHWLHDAGSLQAMCDAAEVSAKDVVLEIGPGLGTLTELLIKRAKHVTAVEFDNILALALPGRMKNAGNLDVVSQDILSFDFTSLPPNYKVVANIPYYLTSNLIRVLSETPNPPSTAVILIQKEVAERVAAEPGAMSILSVTAQIYWEVSLGMLVPAHLFTPAPKVDSQILILKRRTTPLFADLDIKTYFQVVKAGYSQKRKTILNSLSGGLQLDKPTVKALCDQVGIAPTKRAQTLTLEDWYWLSKAYSANT
jgi:16S rRNA (adenine1518-N6/adenine1519-N6)-dimethyltransferase